MMENLILNEESIEGCPMVILVIKESWFRGFENFPQMVRITSPPLNYENLKDVTYGVCKLQVTKFIHTMLNLNKSNIHKDEFIKSSCL